MPISIQLKKRDSWLKSKIFHRNFLFIFFFSQKLDVNILIGVDFLRVFASLCIDKNISVLIILV